MPKNFDTYIIDTFRGGISEENDKGGRGSFKHGYAGNIRARNDTYTAKQAMAEITPADMSDLGKFIVPASDGSTYVFGDTGSIWARSGDGEWTFIYSDENGEIKGAAEWKVSDGNNYIFWATDTSLARVAVNGSPDATWAGATQDYKATLDSADEHTMKIASGQLMIANGQYLASVDYDDNFDNAAVNVRPDNRIKCLEERDDYVVMGSKRPDDREEGHIWSWVVTAINWVQKKLIPVKGVNAMITAEIPLIQGGSDGEIFTSDFNETTPLIGIPLGGQVNPGGVTVEDDIALFGFYGGTYPGIWSLGRKRKNQLFSLNYDYRMSKAVSGSTISEIGAIEMVNGELLATYTTTDGSTTDYIVDQVSSTNKATALFEGLEFDNGKPYERRWYEMVKVLFKPLASGTSLSIKFKQDQEDNWRYSVLGDGQTTHAVSAGYHSTQAEFLIKKPGAVYEVGMELNPNSNDSPEVTDIVTYVEKGGYEHG